MRSSFPLFQGHLDLAHHAWEQIAKPGDTVVDATCGNGWDTLYLAQLVLGENFGRVIGMDIQEQAIQKTETLLEESLPEAYLGGVHLIQQSHETFPKELEPESVKLIVYNFGYLPGGNKELTTLAESSIQSLNHALELVQPGGALSLTLYPGHATGAVERDAIVEFVASLPPQNWSCCHHQWANRSQAPSWLLIQKAEQV